MRQMALLFLLTSFLFLLTGCGGSEGDLPENLNGVILDERGSTDLQYIGYPGQRWQPKANQAINLEEDLPDYLREAAPDLLLDLDSYGRQYAGATGEDGRRLIFANFFCDPESWDNWRTQLLIVMDGGDCYFQVLYDPAARTFVSLSINGEA